MANIADIQHTIIEEFGIFDNWMDKYEYLIDLGKAMPPLDVDQRDDKFLVKGCQSQVWLLPRMDLDNSLLYFDADSDALIAKGIIGLLIRTYSGQAPENILAANEDFITTIGLTSHLSPNRSNGLVSMIQQMKAYATVFNQQMKLKQS